MRHVFQRPDSTTAMSIRSRNRGGVGPSCAADGFLANARSHLASTPPAETFSIQPPPVLSWTGSTRRSLTSGG